MTFCIWDFTLLGGVIRSRAPRLLNGQQMRGTWSLAQKLRTGAARHQRTRISVQMQACWLDMSGLGKAASTNSIPHLGS